jgi:N-carbamoylputrescine amidase
MNLALIQMNSKEKARDENVQKACTYIDRAAESKPKPDLIVLPEFFNTEYFFFRRDYSYISYAEPANGFTISAIKKKAQEHKVHIVATIYEEEGPGLYFDSAMVINPEGEIVGKYRKTHPAAVTSLEKIYFKRGSRFPIFNILGWKIGISICYDNFFPETGRVLSVKGAELILMPFATPHFEMWDNVMSTRALDNLAFVAPCNKVGKECGYVFGGRSLIISPYGEIIKKCGGDKDEIITASLDQKQVYEARRRWPTFRDRRPEIYSDLVKFEEDARSL